MKRPALLLPALLCGVLAAAPAPAQAPVPGRLERLGWMAGSWAFDSAGVRSEEHWMAPAGGLMVGMNRSVRDGRARMFEFLRIRERGDTIAYLASPGARPATTFPLTELADRRVTFENPEHDFPQRVMYWLADDGRLHARVDGALNGRAMSENYVWTRVGGTGEARLATPSGGPASTADSLADRLLGAIGGRAAWARLRNLVNDSQQNRVDEPTVVRAVITMDFERPRFRIETTGPDLRLVRVVDGERHWRLNRAGQIEPVPAATLEADRRWHAGHVYRTLHRVARRDPALRLGVDADGRLEVFEGPDRIAWYALDAKGEPYAFGGFRDSIGSLSGPWAFEQDGVRHPVWTSARDGGFRARIQSLRVNAALDDASFAKP